MDNLPDEFTELERILIDCDNIGETAYMMPMTQLKELLTALNEALAVHDGYANRLEEVSKQNHELKVALSDAREDLAKPEAAHAVALQDLKDSGTWKRAYMEHVARCEKEIDTLKAD